MSTISFLTSYTAIQSKNSRSSKHSYQSSQSALSRISNCVYLALQFSSAVSNFSNSRKEPFPKIGADVSLHILSYLEYSDLTRFSAVSEGARILRDSRNFQLERIIFSKIRIFDRAHWKEYYNVEITDRYDANKINCKVLRRFLTVFYGKHPLNGPGRVCDYCLIPAVVPSRIKRREPSPVEERYSLFHLGKLAEHPLKGYAAKFVTDQPKIFQMHGNIIAESSSLVIQLKGVIGRNKCWTNEFQRQYPQGQVQLLNKIRTNTGWGCLPDAISQNTIIVAHHAVTGKRPHGDETGIEGCSTVGRTVEQVLNAQMCSGLFRKMGGGQPSELMFRIDNCGYPASGVVLQRKFY